MKKVVIHKPGGFDQLKIEEHDSPVPNPDEVKINVKAIGINYADIVIRWGLYKSAKEFVGWPITPGFEVAGTVESVGNEVSSFKPGDRVFGVTLFNGYSTEICIPQHQVFNLPQKMTFEQGAGFPTVFLTAYHAMFQNIVMRKGMRVLVHSAAGGVGSALLQLNKLLETDVIGVVGASHKVDIAKAMGAGHVIDKSRVDLWKTVEKIFPEGADVIFDANGGRSLKKGFDSLAKGGKIIVYGTHTILPKKSGTINYLKLLYNYLTAPKFHSLKLNTRSIIAFNLSYMFHKISLLQEAMSDLLKWIEENRIHPLEFTPFEFEEVREAQKSLQSGMTTGKIVLQVNEMPNDQ